MHPPAKNLSQQTASKLHGKSQDSLSKIIFSSLTPLDSFAGTSHSLGNSVLFHIELASSVDLVDCNNLNSKSDLVRVIVLIVSRQHTQCCLSILSYCVDSLSTNR